MFDTYNVRPGSDSHHHTHTVTEKRAPTDESVRLLKEMEREALDKLLKSVRIEDCAIDCVVHKWEDHMHLADRYIVQFRVNGRQYRVDHEVKDCWGTDSDRREKTVAGLVDAVAKSIAVEMLSAAFKNSRI